MSSRLEQLYQETILDHNKNPRFFGQPEDSTHKAHGKNPLCGDDYWVYLDIKDGMITDVHFNGSGCAISKSSASMMAESIRGKSLSDVVSKKDAFLKLLTEDGSIQDDLKGTLGKLIVFEGVKKYPARVKCAALSWRALEAALDGAAQVSTE
jgi:nitrogen fixation NifU-like protein